MDSFVLTLIAITTFTCIKANEQIEVYEIRKVKDDLDYPQEDDGNTELRVDDQYYDPDEFDRIKYGAISNANANHKNSGVNLVTNNLLEKLARIVKSKHITNRKEDDDYIANYKDLRDERFENNGKTPVVIVADRSVLYHILPQKSRTLQNNLQSVLRSINPDDEVEDRTAPPRVKIYYDYEYD